MKKAILLDVYRRLVTIRLVDEAIAREYPKQEMRCPIHLSIGQEAVSAGAAAALEPGDALFGTHRSHGPYLARGGSIKAMLAEIYGKAAGCCGGRGGSMHLVDQQAGFWGSVPIVGSTIPIATGAALAFALRGQKFVSMVFLGEASTEEGVFHESLQYAALKNLPIVFVCENNAFSVNTPLSERRPPRVSIAGLAKAHGVPVWSGDGNDAVFVYLRCKRAADRARRGNGPAFFEFFTYRWLEHCGPNDDHHLPCRSLDDFRAWKERCPLARMEKTLAAAGVSEEQMRNIQEAIKHEINAAMAYARNAPDPDAGSASSGVYALPDQGW